MKTIRLGLLVFWAGLAGLPIVVLAHELWASPTAWNVWQELARLASLQKNTLLLVVGTLELTIPAGCVTALILYRSDLASRFVLRRLVVLSMFIPLPLFASAWQLLISLLGFGTKFLESGWGLLAAIVIHSAAALPWVVWLIGQGFRWVDRHIEEDALMHCGAWSAFRHVTLPRAVPAIAMACVWVGIQTASEITITDMCQVRTFAEEVYTEIARPDPTIGRSADGLSRALAVSVPPALLVGLLVAMLVWSLRHQIPPLGVAPPTEWPLIRFQSGRFPATAMIALLLIAATGVPIASLVWKAGRIPPDRWSIDVFFHQLARAWHAQSMRMFASLLWSAVTAGAVASIALVYCWTHLERPRSWRLFIMSAILVWSLPGPVIGIGLKESINSLMNAEDAVTGHRADFRTNDATIDGNERADQPRTEVFRTLLYNSGTPLPIMWAIGLRFIPCAFALLWPVVQLIPRNLREEVRVDSGSAATEFRRVVMPITMSALCRSALIGTALCLGELSASKIVETPGAQSFSHEIFMQMHTGVSNHLAAMCLILLAVIALLGAVIGVIPMRNRIG